ncbi:MAG: indole-3-glycerol phosphate synthase, partial [bacterium]
RDLSTFVTDINHSVTLKKSIPESVTIISESGIHTNDDYQFLQAHGFDAILVGESLMRKPNPGKAIHELKGNTND